MLGQSFGGFCIARYLSVAPRGVKEAFFTGGLPPLVGSSFHSLGVSDCGYMDHTGRHQLDVF
jgi:hypothetical protein